VNVEILSHDIFLSITAECTFCDHECKSVYGPLAWNVPMKPPSQSHVLSMRSGRSSDFQTCLDNTFSRSGIVTAMVVNDVQAK